MWRFREALLRSCVFKCMLACFIVFEIHGTVVWSTGSLTCVCYLFYKQTHGGGGRRGGGVYSLIGRTLDFCGGAVVVDATWPAVLQSR